MEVERVELETLEGGRKINVIAGVDPLERYIYDFTIIEPGNRPVCELVQTSPDGASIGPIGRVILEGAGIWTTPEQNPLQRGDVVMGIPRQERALSIGWGALYIGGFMTIVDPVARDRYYLQPAITSIDVSEE